MPVINKNKKLSLANGKTITHVRELFLNMEGQINKSVQI